MAAARSAAQGDRIPRPTYEAPMPYIIGIDTGGTFTDCVVIDAGGRIITAKAPSTPDDFSEGVMESLSLAAERLGLAGGTLPPDTPRLAPGPTGGTKALLERRGGPRRPPPHARPPPCNHHTP